MADRRYRVLAICAHPVQYMSPVLRRMAQHPQLDLQVVYCSLRGAEASHDPEFGATVKWDVPLLDGYPWVQLPNVGSGDESFFGLCNPGLWSLLRDGNFDAALCFTGYPRATFWIAYLRARLSKVAFLFGGDATTLIPIDGQMWKRHVKRIVWPMLFRLASQVIVPSTGTRDLMVSLGIAPERVTLTPYSVDNEWWIAKSQQVDRNAVRASWGATSDTSVVLYCAKLQPWKRPQDLLRAFAKLNLPNAFLVIAGEGPLRAELERETSSLGLAERVRFLGFMNQTQLPAIYTAADLLVLPSSYEAFGVVVNEAYLCGCPVVASDHVGAARDLIVPVDPDLVYPCGDVEALAGVLKRTLSDRVQLSELGRAAGKRMENWSPRENIAGVVEAIGLALSRMRRDAERPNLPSRAPKSGVDASQKEP
jgi:glycosyltransferase involved in cell wall biosynthesis